MNGTADMTNAARGGGPKLGSFYLEEVERIQEREYPYLKDAVYLDHAGTTLYAKSLMEAFSRDMMSNLFGNPHSISSSSQLSTRRIDDTRLRVLQFLNASPDDFDVVFVANATAGIKLVADALRDSDEEGFWYGYHADAHTSLVGVREVAKGGHRCFRSDKEVEGWLEGVGTSNVERSRAMLFAYPGQSNMTGRRLPLSWCRRLRKCASLSGQHHILSLLDAASLASTSQLDLSDCESAPDFTVLSFYKIFGFPDLGALIVRKASAHAFCKRSYFGGGTVGMVGNHWYEKKSSSLHEQLEDGTLPFHSIIALQLALDIHNQLYGSMENVSRHTGTLTATLFKRLSAKRHANGTPVCKIYRSPQTSYNDTMTQGPIICFNLKNSMGQWVEKSEVEKLASVKNIQLRSGGLCNPGGVAHYLQLSDDEMRRNYDAGQRCGDNNDVIDGKPTGVLRVSLGAMSTTRDVEEFINFIDEFYVDKEVPISNGLPTTNLPTSPTSQSPSTFYIDKLCVYPIKSCGAFVVPPGERWEVRSEGLTWDREWCLIHQGTGVALSQKKYPRMALIRPFIDIERGVLRVSCGMKGANASGNSVEVPLSEECSDFTAFSLCESSTRKTSTVCGDRVNIQAYSSPQLSTFFSNFLEVPCTLARFPSQVSQRFFKSGRRSAQQQGQGETSLSPKMPGSFPQSTPSPSDSPSPQRPILLSNESPMLLISRSSVNRLNEAIKSNGKSGNNKPKAVAADVFRANIVVAEEISTSPSPTLPSVEQPYIEDTWTGFQIGWHKFEILSSCQRCQMVCVDQDTAERSQEPFSTLVKTRRMNGKVVFGRHVCLIPPAKKDGSHHDDRRLLVGADRRPMVQVGDVVTPFYD
ncbi:hypothetical protein AJ80_00258 [Polytolypa hystricis UAMH7299]|uniref:Molybdenum cofactor sulfurase n=1 Tax=Polytolypa hystricis (strain UAMH7299) TaxID=1447883 RepID=A0A2B7Z439_POLH7|nr:hypothetical protein AJ80_00258 [Polytolypa hystricis UAMH7299]